MPELASTDEFDPLLFEQISQLGSCFVDGEGVIVMPIFLDDQPAYAVCEQDDESGHTAVFAVLTDENLLDRITRRDGPAVRVSRRGAST